MSAFVVHSCRVKEKNVFPGLRFKCESAGFFVSVLGVLAFVKSNVISVILVIPVIRAIRVIRANMLLLTFQKINKRELDFSTAAHQGSQGSNFAKSQVGKLARRLEKASDTS